tara:strand:+ start:4066 stop:4266 length:201 start_codon:yes stop_codon:yes gene_type:complete
MVFKFYIFAKRKEMIMANSYRGASQVNTNKAELVEQEFIYRGIKYISAKQPTQPHDGIYRGVKRVA